MQAIDAAASGSVEEGNVGGGTGMRCFGFKGGIGTSSRVFDIQDEPYTLGVLVQCNTGQREVLRIAGAPVGQELSESWLPCYDPKWHGQVHKEPLCEEGGKGGESTPDDGSIIIVVGTDAPLVPIQLDRVARRAAMGLGRLGAFSGNTSGNLIVSFSTAENANDVRTRRRCPLRRSRRAS
jgi:D-aminopeptidase